MAAWWTRWRADLPQPDAIRAMGRAVRIPIGWEAASVMDAAARMLDEIGLTESCWERRAARPGLVTQAVKRYTDRIAIGIDARNGPWPVGLGEDTDVSAIDLALRMRDIGVKTLIIPIFRGTAR